MRWLFLFVVLLNLIYFSWQSSQTSSVDYVDVPALRDVEPIVLLSELKQQKKSDKDPVEEVPAEQLDAEPVVEQSLEVIAEVPIAETPVVTEPAKTKVIAVEAVVPEELPPQASCYTMGPFRDLEKLRSLTREIKSYVLSTDFRGYEEKEQALYWVYILPEKTRKKAIATGRRLKAKRIKDFYVIREGEKTNGVSLGYFRKKGSAYGLAKKVRKLGFNVTVEPTFKVYTIYWLDYQLTNGMSIPESTLDKYIKTDEKGKISRLSRECSH